MVSLNFSLTGRLPIFLLSFYSSGFLCAVNMSRGWGGSQNSDAFNADEGNVVLIKGKQRDGTIVCTMDGKRTNKMTDT